MIGREKIEILYLLAKSIVLVLEELIGSPQSLHQSSTIESGKFNLCDSVCGQIPYEIISQWKCRWRKLWCHCQSVPDPSGVSWCKIPDKWCAIHRTIWQFMTSTVEVTNFDLRKSSMNLTIFRSRLREARCSQGIWY